MTKTIEVTIELDSEMLESVVAGKVFQIDATKAHNRGLAKLLYYGAQRYCNDGTSPDGKDTPDTRRHELAAGKVERIMTGDVDRVSNPADPYSRLRKYIRAILRKNAAVIAHAKKRGTKVDSDFVDAVFATQPEAKVSAILERAEKMYADEHGDIELNIESVVADK